MASSSPHQTYRHALCHGSPQHHHHHSITITTASPPAHAKGTPGRSEACAPTHSVACDRTQLVLLHHMHNLYYCTTCTAVRLVLLHHMHSCTACTTAPHAQLYGLYYCTTCTAAEARYPCRAQPATDAGSLLACWLAAMARCGGCNSRHPFIQVLGTIADATPRALASTWLHSAPSTHRQQQQTGGHGAGSELIPQRPLKSAQAAQLAAAHTCMSASMSASSGIAPALPHWNCKSMWILLKNTPRFSCKALACWAGPTHSGQSVMASDQLPIMRRQRSMQAY
jgi:hypothetical protein